MSSCLYFLHLRLFLVKINDAPYYLCYYHSHSFVFHLFFFIFFYITFTFIFSSPSISTLKTKHSFLSLLRFLFTFYLLLAFSFLVLLFSPFKIFPLFLYIHPFMGQRSRYFFVCVSSRRAYGVIRGHFGSFYRDDVIYILGFMWPVFFFICVCWIRGWMGVGEIWGGGKGGVGSVCVCLCVYYFGVIHVSLFFFVCFVCVVFFFLFFLLYFLIFVFLPFLTLFFIICLVVYSFIPLSSHSSLSNFLHYSLSSFLCFLFYFPFPFFQCTF